MLTFIMFAGIILILIIVLKCSGGSKVLKECTDNTINTIATIIIDVNICSQILS